MDLSSGRYLWDLPEQLGGQVAKFQVNLFLPLITFSCYPVPLRSYLSWWITVKHIRISSCGIFSAAPLLAAFPYQLVDGLEYDRCAVRTGWARPASLLCWYFIGILPCLKWWLRQIGAMKRWWWFVFFFDLHIGISWLTLQFVNIF